MGTIASGVSPPRFLKNQDCDPTSEDILGPYWIENHPYRIVLAHSEEPGTRVFISGTVKVSDCETPIQNAVVDVWHANNNGCYTVFQECDTGNPDNDPYNLRGQMLTNENGEYAFESIWPGYYGNRPKHFHYKITTPGNTELITQCYFEVDPQVDEQWEENHPGLVIPVEENEGALYGVFDIVINQEIQMDASEKTEAIPSAPYLKNGHPNPFNSSTQIEFGLSSPGHVSISIYDITGRWITNLIDSHQSQGACLLIWSGTNEAGKPVPSGHYLVVMKSAGFTGSKKILLLK